MGVKVKFFLTLMVIFLAGCSGKVYDRAYTASGDGNEEKDLQADTQFNTTDDLNVVIKLNQHDDPVQVEAQFIDPNKDVMETVTAEAASAVETVILGVDFEARADQVNQWVAGPYEVKIFIDGEAIETLRFRID